MVKHAHIFLTLAVSMVVVAIAVFVIAGLVYAKNAEPPPYVERCRYDYCPEAAPDE